MKQKYLLMIVIFIFAGCGYANIPNVDLTPEIKLDNPGEQRKQDRAKYNHGSKYQMQMSRMMFSYMFSAGGIWPWQKDFTPGEWTKWRITSGEEQKYITELASLKQAEDNKKWWRIKTATDKGSTLIYEALIHSDDYSIRRLRSKINDQQPQELPVRENSHVYNRPMELTEESIKAASVGNEKINVPAGTFKTKHIKYGTPANQGKINIWMNKDVPGGVVKYNLAQSEGANAFTAELLDYGKGATTVLNSY